ncbi:MAG TPA: hypothetical protein V6C58_23170 [Allocoleopsis sp.]
MSWINENLQILNLQNEVNELAQEVDNIGQFTGYFLSLVPQNGIGITGSGASGYTITCTDGNNTQWAYSTLTKQIFNITFTINFNSNNNVWVGISESLSDPFVNPSAPSMEYCKYGMLIDQMGGNENLLEIENGIFSSTAYKWGTTYNITYDGTTLKYYVDGVNVISHTTTLTPCYLVLGSFQGGTIDNVNWSGSGGSSSPSTNLAEVLATGNDAQNQDIVEVRNLGVNQVITISNEYDNISMLQFLYEGTDNQDYFALVGSTADTGNLSFSKYNNGNLLSTPLELTQTQINLSVPTVSSSSFTSTGYNIDISGNTGVCFDNVSNFPNICAITNLSGIDLKPFNANSPTSLLLFKPTTMKEYLNNYTLFFKTLNFTFDILVGSGITQNLNVLLYLSTTLNGDVDNTNPLNIGWTSPNLNFNTGGQPLFNGSNIFTSFFDTTGNMNNNGIYLNVKIVTNNNSQQFQLTDVSIVSQLSALYYGVENYNNPTILN